MKTMQQLWADAEANPNIAIDIGRTVVCDICDEDFTDRTECGGFIFGSKGYCPLCAPSGLVSIKRYAEERYIRATCPDGQSFADFVRAYRGGNNAILVATLP